jgi:hypothetical protein
MINKDSARLARLESAPAAAGDSAACGITFAAAATGQVLRYLATRSFRMGSAEGEPCGITIVVDDVILGGNSEP